MTAPRPSNWLHIGPGHYVSRDGLWTVHRAQRTRGPWQVYSGGRAGSWVGDAMTASRGRGLADRLAAQYGPLRVFVNRMGSLQAARPEDFRRAHPCAGVWTVSGTRDGDGRTVQVCDRCGECRAEPLSLDVAMVRAQEAAQDGPAAGAPAPAAAQVPSITAAARALRLAATGTPEWDGLDQTERDRWARGALGVICDLAPAYL